MISCHDLNSHLSNLDKCSFVQKYCTLNGRIYNYLNYIYCVSEQKEWAAILSLVLLLLFVFTVFGRAATQYLCPNLASISSYLHLPQSISGVTLAAFGNGAPDLFSTFAAVQANSFPLALGELLGAANFVTLVVVGSVVLIHPFKIPKYPFTRVIIL